VDIVNGRQGDELLRGGVPERQLPRPQSQRVRQQVGACVPPVQMAERAASKVEWSSGV
jgi:hypothetical protein